jgi:putrescine transport system substrate-binding protein
MPYRFIDYLLRPEVIAACTNYTGYANANKAALPLVDPAIAADPAIYPDAETLRGFTRQSHRHLNRMRAITRIWTEIKAGG